MRSITVWGGYKGIRIVNHTHCDSYTLKFMNFILNNYESKWTSWFVEHKHSSTTSTLVKRYHTSRTIPHQSNYTTPVKPDTTPAKPDTTPAKPDTTPAERYHTQAHREWGYYWSMKFAWWLKLHKLYFAFCYTLNQILIIKTKIQLKILRSDSNKPLEMFPKRLGHIFKLWVFNAFNEQQKMILLKLIWTFMFSKRQC